MLVTTPSNQSGMVTGRRSTAVPAQGQSRLGTNICEPGGLKRQTASMSKFVKV